MLKTNVVKFRKPKVFTDEERLIEEVVSEMWKSGLSWKKLSELTNLSSGTVQRLASGVTKWPRPNTLFSILKALRLGLVVVKEDK